MKGELSEGECPYILPGEEELLNNSEKRLRKKCFYCVRFLEALRRKEEDTAHFLKVALSELREKERETRGLKQFLQLQREQLSVLHRVSEILNLSLDLKEIAYVTLLSLTAGELFGFNRAFLLLYDRETRRFKGYFGMGPRTPEEALAIWESIEKERQSLPKLLESFSPEKFEKEREKLKDLLRAFELEIDKKTEAFLFGGKRTMIVREKSGLLPFFEKIFEILQSPFFVLLTLVTKEGPIGVIIADNFVTGLDIQPERTDSLEIFAYQASLALHRAALYRYLEEKLRELEEMNKALKQYHEKMAKLEKMAAVGEIIHQITHEFKNPLTVIGGLSRELLKETDEADPKYKYLQAISEEAERLIDILNRTVDEARRRFSISKEPVDINSLLRARLQEYMPLFKARNIELRFEEDTDLSPVIADPVQIQVCFDNVILNAIEAMPDGGVLEVKSRRNEDGLVEVTFRDTGVGIPEEIIEKIFEPYFTTKEKGSGLGLYNTREIMKAHGGEIKIDSELGKGTEVKLIFRGGENAGKEKAESAVCGR